MSACVQQTGGRVRRGAAYYRSISAARDSGTRSMSDVTHSGAVSKLLVTNAWSGVRNQRRSIHTKPTGEEKKNPRIRTAVGRSGRTSVVVGAETRTRTRTRIRMRMRVRVSAREDRAGKGQGLLTEVLAHGRDVEQRLDAELGEQRLVPDACPAHKQTNKHRISRRGAAPRVPPRTHRIARAAAASAASLSRPTKKKRRVSATLSKRKKSPPGARTGRKHDLPLHMDHVLHARHHELDAARDEVRAPFRAARVEEHAGGLCAGEDDEVGAVCVGLVVRLRRRRRRRA